MFKKFLCFLFGHSWSYYSKSGNDDMPDDFTEKILFMIKHQHRTCTDCWKEQKWNSEHMWRGDFIDVKTETD